MNGNEIIARLHRHREQLARDCGYDVKKLMDYYRRREREHEQAGHELVSFVESAPSEKEPLSLREIPPKK
ncbi:MAG: hypothetical protein ACYDH9_21320 [Limisphaerales bacterium]